MSTPRRSFSDALGLPLWALVVLALLAVPRVVLHDLGVLTPGTLINSLFVFVPAVIWVLVLAIRRVPHPLITSLIIGLLYGIFLAVGHQLLWSYSFAGNPPQLGGNLADLSPMAQAVITRGFAVVSSLLTGAAVGLLVGLVGLLISWMRKRSDRPLSQPDQHDQGVR